MYSKLTLKNFLSWQALDFNFPKGVTLIEGYNYDDNSPEGCGKSAILNGMTWVIYGNIPKEVKVNQIIREGSKKAEGTLTFESGHVIKRSRTNASGTLELFLPDGRQYLGKDIKETQTYIDELMGMTYDTFLQSVYFAQNYGVKFITSDEKSRVKVLSDIADLTVFDKAIKETTGMLKLEKESKSSLENELNTAKFKVEEAQSLVLQVERYKEQAETAQKERVKAVESQIETKAEKLETLVEFLESNTLPKLTEYLNTTKTELNFAEEKIEELNVKLSSVDGIKAKKKGLESQYKAVESDLNRVLQTIGDKQDTIKALKVEVTDKAARLESAAELAQTKIDKLENKIEALKDPDNTECPTCGSELSPDSKHIETEIQSLEESLNEITKEIEVKIEAQEALELKNKEKGEALGAEILTLTKSTKSLTEQMKDIKNDINAIELPDLSSVSKKLTERKLEKKSLNDALLEIQTKMKEVEQKEILADELVVELETLEQTLKDAQEEEVSSFDKDIKAAQNKVKTAKVQVNSIEDLLKGKTKRIGDLTALREGFKETKAYTFKALLRDLTNKSNYYLAQLFDLPISIEFTNETEAGGIAKITDVVTIGDVQRPFALYSGGQSRRIQLAVDLALSDIVASRGDKPIGIRLFDEYMKDLSENSMEKVLELFEELEGSVLMIEHNSIIKNVVNNNLEIELRNGVSRCL